MSNAPSSHRSWPPVMAGVSEQSMGRTLRNVIAAAAYLVGTGFAHCAEKVPTAFVGSFLRIEKIACESGAATDAVTGEAEVVICMDALFRATYRVEKVLEGRLIAGSEVVFTVADHYGVPKFAELKRAMIFLSENENGYYHIKYQWEPAFRTSDGDFAQCGCRALATREDQNDKSEPSSDCRSISFSPAVIQDLTHLSPYMIDEMRTGMDYKIRANQAECVRGILVKDLYRRLRPDLVEDINVR